MTDQNFDLEFDLDDIVAVIAGFLVAGLAAYATPARFIFPESTKETITLFVVVIICLSRLRALDRYFHRIGLSSKPIQLDIFFSAYLGIFIIWGYLPALTLSHLQVFPRTSIFSIVPPIAYFLGRAIYLRSGKRPTAKKAENDDLDEVFARCAERTLQGFADTDIDYSSYSERLERILLEGSNSALTIGLTGRWGIGKSSILKTATQSLIKNNYVVCYLSAWDYRAPENILEGILNSLRATIAEHTYIPELDDFVLKAASQLLDKQSNWLAVQFESPRSLKETAAIINTSLTAADIHCILILDDVDRLDPRESIAIFRALHLLRELNRVKKVVSYDRQRFGKLADPGDDSSSNYIQKVIDVEISIPTPSEPEIFKLFEHCVAPLQLSDDDQKRFHAEFDRHSRKIFSSALKTPRDIKRVALRIAMLWDRLGSDLNFCDLFAVSIIHEIYPDLYRMIHERPHLFSASEWGTDYALLLDKGALKSARENTWKSIGDRFDTAALNLIDILFPSITAHTEYGTKNLPDQEKSKRDRRIYHPDAFDRYFSATTRKDLITENTLEESARTFMALPDERQAQFVENIFRASAQNGSLDSLFRGWKIFIDQINRE